MISLLLLIVVISPYTLLSAFTQEQQLTIFLLIFAIYLWTVSSMPTGVSSILLLASMILFGLVDSIEEAMVGFLSPALYFIFILTVISKVLVKVEIDKEITYHLLKLSKNGIGYVIVILPIMMSILPFLIPSSFARFKMLLPLVDSLNNLYEYPKDSLFRKYSLYVIGIMNQNSTIIVYTGGGFPILAAQLLSDYNVANLGWIEWILLIAPPLWLGLLVVNIFTWYFLKKNNKSTFDFKKSDLKIDAFQGAEKNFEYWFVIITFIIVILIWAFTDQSVIPILLPPMLLLSLYAIPKLGLVTNQDIREFEWENFLLIGSSFSIGILMEANGTAEAIAYQLIGLIPSDISLILKIIAIAIFIFLMRMIFIIPTSAIIVIFPIVISYAELLNIPPLSLGLLVVMIIGGSNILPIHAPPSFFAFNTGALSKKEHYTIASTSSFVLVSFAILAAYFYW